MKSIFSGLSVGEKVFFIPDNRFYVISEIGIDVLYLIDEKENPLTAMISDIDLNKKYIL
ncbi:hypothetical protein [Bacillus phage vB_BanS-Thrax5]|nr:hypothetical protein [Bacillus phage vB_BanS-Thrax5]